ncbi:MAG TPA: hypothetical protein VD816_12635 [Ohtaekwangia sp.]|nr:hypothetical protein [Ohtaekwangia sp.]
MKAAYGFGVWLLILLSSCSPNKESSTGELPADNNISRTYYADGALHKEMVFKDGSKTGTSREYYRSGQVFQEVHYENNLREGVARRYYENGIVNQETPYKGDKMHGIQKKYRRSGKLMAEIPYFEGNLCKGLKEYTVNGELKKRYPEIVVTPIDRILKDGTYTLEFRMSDDSKDGVEFYEGKLTNGQYIGDDAGQIWDTQNGVGRLTYRLQRGIFVMEEISIIAKVKTVQSNYYITETNYHLAAENRY